MAYYQDPNAGQQYQQAPQTYNPGYSPQQQQPGYPPQQQQQYPQQQFQQPAPAAYAGGQADASPLMATESKSVMRIEKGGDQLMKRETFPHKNFDIDTLQDIEGLRDMKYDWQFRVETALACWIMFNAVSTIMIILTNFRRGVDPALRTQFGEQEFDTFMGFITYFPLVFFFVVILLLNNFYSEITFYMYLKRGCIVDFPESASVKLLFTRIIPLLFIVTVLAYTVTVIGAFLKFKATVGVMLIFFNNVAVGVGMSWYRQQSIEGKFVSISNFIQSFPDRDGEYGNMDEQSLHSAAQYLQSVTLTECEEPSYNGYMRNFYWQNKNYSTVQRIFHHVVIFLIIGVMAGMCVAYFVVLRGLDLKSVWTNEINPCVSTCVGMYQNASGPMSNDDYCTTCTCRCLNALRQHDDDVLKVCSEYSVVSACNMRAVCNGLVGKCASYFPKD